MGTGNSVSKILLLFVLLLTGCLPTTPEPATVKETVISEVPVTVEVIREVPVTVEVTRVVEVTPEPVASGTEAAIPWTEVKTLHSSIVGRDYRISVALPLTYPQNTDKTYPVVYLLDGNMWFGMATEITRLLYFYREELPELIIVGIGYATDDPNEVKDLRLVDLTPTRTQAGTGEAGEFLKFIQEDLIPYIDVNYRTDPIDRTIVGQSVGGLFSLYVLFHAPETFDRYVVSSPSLWWDNRVTFQYEEEFARKHSELPVKLFLSVGELEEKEWPDARLVSNLQELHRRLEARNYDGLEMEMVVMKDETHSSVFPGAFTKGLKTVFR